MAEEGGTYYKQIDQMIFVALRVTQIPLITMSIYGPEYNYKNK